MGSLQNKKNEIIETSNNSIIYLQRLDRQSDHCYRQINKSKKTFDFIFKNSFEEIFLCGR